MRCLRVRDAVTPNGGVWFSFAIIAIVYAGLGTGATVVLRSMSRRWRETATSICRRRTVRRPNTTPAGRVGRDEPGRPAAALLFVGVVVYAVFGGADFGSGIWDLLAGDAERGGALRTQIDHSIGPVWEANHVWLIYVLVFMWTAFPTGFAAMITTLWRSRGCSSGWASSSAAPASRSASSPRRWVRLGCTVPRSPRRRSSRRSSWA